MLENIKDWILFAALVVGASLILVFSLVAILLFYGALFGAIGAGIYLTFKGIVGVFP